MNYNSNSDERLLRLIGITYNQIESGVYALVLEEVGGQRRIPIVIGFPEAQAIECKLQEVVSPRPLTHDLIVSLISEMGGMLEKVVIRRLPSGVFAAYLHIICKDGSRLKLDSRSSDAIAVAIRTGSPIFTSARVLDEAGFYPNESLNTRRNRLNDQSSSLVPDSAGDSEDSPLVPDYTSMSREELITLMEEAVSQEDYEKAAEIKKIIDNL